MNTRRMWCGAWLSLMMSGAVALSGQGPQTLEKPADRIAVTGCVSRVETPAGATAAIVENRAVGSRGTFVLLKATASTAPTTSSSSTTNAAAKQTRTPTATQYRLDGADSMVAPYVNHQVEITGISGQPTASRSGAKGSAGAPTLTVESIRMLATECP